MAEWNWLSYGLGAASVPVAYLAVIWSVYGIKKLVALVRPKVETVVDKVSDVADDALHPDNLDKK